MFSYVSTTDIMLFDELVADRTINYNDVDYIIGTWQRACAAPHAEVGVYGIIDGDGGEVFCNGIATSLKRLAELVDDTINCTPADNWFISIISH